MPSSCDNSPIVRRAPGSFCPAVANDRALPGDPVAHDLAGAEGHHPPWRDRYFDARLRVPADTLAFVAQDESAEARHLDVLSLGQGVAPVVKHALYQSGGFRARQAEAVMDDIGQIGTSQSVCGVRF